MVDTDKREMIDKSNQLEVLEQAAKIAIRFTAVPRDLLGPPSDAMKSRAALGEKIADAIRSIPPIVTAIPKASAALTAAPLQAQEPVALPTPAAYRYPCAGENNGFNYTPSIVGEEARFVSLWEPMFTKAQVELLMHQRVSTQPVAVPDVLAEPTYMTEDQGCDWAWKDVKKGVGTKGWTAGDNGNFFGFFLHGWNYRGQFEKQRAAPAAQGDAKKTFVLVNKDGKYYHFWDKANYGEPQFGDRHGAKEMSAQGCTSSMRMLTNAGYKVVRMAAIAAKAAS